MTHSCYLPQRPLRLLNRFHPWMQAAALSLVLFAVVGTKPAEAQTGEAAKRDAGPGGLDARPARVRLNLERVQLPGNENMGLLGTSYLVEVTPGLSIGPAAYGAISGQRGGLFTVGVEASWTRRIAGPLGVELGLYVGGGGGSNAPDGDGLMLRPHADLWWELDSANRLGLSLSQVRFVNGEIDSHQLGLVWSRSTAFRYVPGARLGEPASSAGRSGVGFDRFRMVSGVYRPRGDAVRLSGAPLASSIGLVGMRLEQTLGENTYWGIEAAGAASGGAAGYAEYLATLGAEMPVWNDRLTLGGRVAAGMGGGGDIPVGGGLLLKGALYGTLQLSPDLGLTLEAGVAHAPQGSFRAAQASAALNWTFDAPGGNGSLARAVRTEWVGGIERYNAQRQDGTSRSLQSVSLRVNRFISPQVYLSGQARSALGGDAGGYSVGLVGIGIQAPLGARWHAGAEVLVGAAGGGGVDTGGGAVAQPMAYLGFDINPAVALRLGAGRIKSLRGNLDSNVVEAMMSFSYGVTGRADK
jgi:hypothetical protein